MTPRFATHPACSLLGILVGWAASVLLIPQLDFAEPGQLAAAGLALAAGILAGFAVSLVRSAASVFRIEHVLMFGLFYWVLLDAVQGAYPLVSASREGVITAFSAIAVFAVSVWIGSVLTGAVRPMQVRPDPRADVGREFLFFAAAASFVLGGLRVWAGCRLAPDCIAESMLYARAGGAGAPWMRGGDFGAWDTVLHQLRYFGYLTLPIAVALHRLEGRLRWRATIAVVLGLLNLLLIIGDSSRRSVGTVVGASALLWILLAPRIGARQVATIAVAAAGLLLMLQAMLAWRMVGFGKAIERGYSLELRGREGLAVDRNLLHLTQLTTLIPDRQRYTGMTGVLTIVSAPLPSSIAPWKPVNRGIDLMGMLGKRTVAGFTWTCTAVGDLYVMAGFLSVIVGGVAFGVLANLGSRLLLRPTTVRSRLLYAVVAMTLFVSLRVIQEIVLTGLVVLAFWGLLVLRRSLLTRRVPAVAVPGTHDH